VAKQAFLIQHIGAVGSGIRARADRVMKEIVSPACERMGYTCVRADQFPHDTIIEPIVSAIASSPLAVADLGSPPWNQNVLIEVGFRMANGKPIVYLADLEPGPDILPIHLANKRILAIEDGGATIERLEEYIGEQRDFVSGWSNQYPTIDIKLPLANPDTAVFVYANEAAARLYGFDTVDELLSTSMEEADRRLLSFMSTLQAKEFHEEQERLFGCALRGIPVTASIPAWFTRHPKNEFNCKPFWPTLLSRKFSLRDDQCLVMRVAFVDLEEWFGPGQPGTSTLISLPKQLRPRSFLYDIFLSYNSADQTQVRVLAEFLKRAGMEVWFDEDNLVGHAGLNREIRAAMADSRIICAVIGQHGLGPWQNSVELSDLLLSVAKQQRPFFVLLLDGVPKDNDKWLHLLPSEYHDFFANRLHATMPPAASLQDSHDEKLTFFRHLVKLFSATFREADRHD